MRLLCVWLSLTHYRPTDRTNDAEFAKTRICVKTKSLPKNVKPENVTCAFTNFGFSIPTLYSGGGWVVPSFASLHGKHVNIFPETRLAAPVRKFVIPNR